MWKKLFFKSSRKQTGDKYLPDLLEEPCELVEKDFELTKGPSKEENLSLKESSQTALRKVCGQQSIYKNKENANKACDYLICDSNCHIGPTFNNLDCNGSRRDSILCQNVCSISTQTLDFNLNVTSNNFSHQNSPNLTDGFSRNFAPLPRQGGKNFTTFTKNGCSSSLRISKNSSKNHGLRQDLFKNSDLYASFNAKHPIRFNKQYGDTKMQNISWQSDSTPLTDCDTWLLAPTSGSDDLGYEGSSLGSNYSPYNTNHRRGGESLNTTDSDLELDCPERSIDACNLDQNDDTRRRTLTENITNETSDLICADHDLSCGPKFQPLKFNLEYLDKNEFVGREWVYQRIYKVLNNAASKGVVIVGKKTTGKSAIVNHIIKHSKFGGLNENSPSPNISNQSTPTEPTSITTISDAAKHPEQAVKQGSCQTTARYAPEDASLHKRRMLLTPQLQRRKIQPFMTPTVTRKQGNSASQNSEREANPEKYVGCCSNNNSIYNAPNSIALGKSPESIVRRKTMLSSSMSFRRISPPKPTDPDQDDSGGHLKTPTSVSKSNYDNLGKELAPVFNAVSAIADRLLAYHMCQVECYQSRCVPEFVCNMVNQLSTTTPSSTRSPSLMACYKDPLSTFYKHFVLPLLKSRANRQIKNHNYVIILDGLEDSQSLYNFVIYSCLPIIPSWIKIILTCRSISKESAMSNLCEDAYTTLCIDYDESLKEQHLCNATNKLNVSNISSSSIKSESTDVTKEPYDNSVQQLLAREDVYRYIAARIERCPHMVQENLVGTVALNHSKIRFDDACSISSNDTSADAPTYSNKSRASKLDYERQLQAASLLPKLVDWLVEVSRGDILYVGSLMDLLEKGEMVVKNASFKILPRTVGEIYALRFNRAFPTSASFQRVKRGLEILLASYVTCNPLTRSSIESALASSLDDMIDESMSNLKCRYEIESSDEDVGWEGELSMLEDYNPEVNTRCAALTPTESIDLLIKYEFINFQKAESSDDGILLFEHPYLGQWLLSRCQDESKGAQDKLSCCLKNGHQMLGIYFASLHKTDLDEDFVFKSAKHLALVDNLPHFDAHSHFKMLVQPQHMTNALINPSNVYRPDCYTSQFLLRCGAEPNAKLIYEVNNPTLLHLVAKKPEHYDFAEILLESGADLNESDDNGANCAIYAVRNGNILFMKNLLNKGYDLNITHSDKENKSALIYAVENNLLDTSILLINSLKAKLASKDTKQKDCCMQHLKRALFIAINNKNLTICKEILKNSCEGYNLINATDENTGLTVLCASILTSKTEETELIYYLVMQAGADIQKGCYQKPNESLTQSEIPKRSISNSFSYTNPLMCASKESNFAIVELLIDQLKQQNPPRSNLISYFDQINGQGHTALMLAAQVGALDIVERLLIEGASVTILDSNGRSILHMTCNNGHEKIASLVIHKAPFLVNVLDKDGLTPLHLAAARGHKNVVQILVDEGNAHMNVLDNEGLSPMDMAVKAYTTLSPIGPAPDQDGRQYLGVVVIFLKRGAKIRSTIWKFLEDSFTESNAYILMMYMLFLNKLSQDGHVLAKNGKQEEAVYRFEYAIKHFPTIDQNQSKTDKEPIDAKCTNALAFKNLSQSFVELRSQLLLNLSRCKLNQRDFSGAISYATKALDIRPNLLEAYYLRATANKYNNQIIPALKDIIAAQEIQPENLHFKTLLSNLKESIVSNSTVSVN